MTAVNGYRGQVAGKGAFDEVFKASKGGEEFAVKVLKQSALKKVRQSAAPPSTASSARSPP